MGTSSMSTAASQPASEAIAVVVMGVAGAGKTTVRSASRRAGRGQHSSTATICTPRRRAPRWAPASPLIGRRSLAMARPHRRRRWRPVLAARRATIVACSALRKRLSRPVARRRRPGAAVRLSRRRRREAMRARVAESAGTLHAGVAGRQPVRHAGAAARRGRRHRNRRGLGPCDRRSTTGGAAARGSSH